MARRNPQGKKKRNLPRIETIYKVQDGICYLCTKKVPHPRTEWVCPHEKASLDHVWPKNPANPADARPRIRKNALVAHHECNNKKANRLPYPCELIFLEAVNDRLTFLAVKSRRY
jgi:hypothetical protein